jgi:hypothetical protein
MCVASCVVSALVLRAVQQITNLLCFRLAGYDNETRRHVPNRMLMEILQLRVDLSLWRCRACHLTYGAVEGSRVQHPSPLQPHWSSSRDGTYSIQAAAFSRSQQMGTAVPA